MNYNLVLFNIMTWVMPCSALMIFLTGLYLCIYFDWINVRQFNFALRLIFKSRSQNLESKEISHFQALTLALSCTIGLMNISGVAIIIALGGPGAIFWMILASFFGMTTKFMEATCGQKYRITTQDEIKGGTMYTLFEAFNKKSIWYNDKRKLIKYYFPFIARVLGLVYAVNLLLTSLILGNIYQVNELVAILASGTVDTSAQLAISIALLCVVFTVIYGGIKKIADVLSYLLPITILIYILLCITILIINLDQLLQVIILIINHAFSYDAFGNGMLASFLFGTSFGAFSNEAGLGTSSVAHSSAHSSEPVKQGLVALLEPFIDTIVICTLTALVILFAYPEGNQLPYIGAQLTKVSMEKFLPWVGDLFNIIVCVFVLSTILSTYYYGMQAWKYIFTNIKFVSYQFVYDFIFLFLILTAFSFNLVDLMITLNILIPLLVIPNLFMILNLMKDIRVDFRAFVRDHESN